MLSINNVSAGFIMSFEVKFKGYLETCYYAGNNNYYTVLKKPFSGQAGAKICHTHGTFSKVVDSICYVPGQEDREETFKTLNEAIEKVQKCSNSIVATFSSSEYSQSVRNCASSVQKVSQWVQNELDSDRRIVKALQELCASSSSRASMPLSQTDVHFKGNG